MSQFDLITIKHVKNVQGLSLGKLNFNNLYHESLTKIILQVWSLSLRNYMCVPQYL